MTASQSSQLNQPSSPSRMDTLKAARTSTPQSPPIPLTQQQSLILQHIFTYRYLTIKHLQTFFGLKYKSRLQLQLNILTRGGYLQRSHDKHNITSAMTPAVYWLLPGGVRHLKTLGRFPESALRRRYYDKSRTPGFIEHCLLMASCCVDLQKSSNEVATYTWITQSGFSSIDKSAPEASYLQELRPHLFFTKQTGSTQVHFTLEHIQSRLPQARLRSRLTQLVEFTLDEWGGPDAAPTVLILCDEMADMIYIKRRVRFIIERDYDGSGAIDIRVALTEHTKEQGITKKIWEDI